MKTEQEVRDAITESIIRPLGKKKRFVATMLYTEEVQDLAVIIGKALGVVEE